MHLFVTRPTAYVSWQRPWPWARTWPAAGKRRAMMARNIQPIGEKPAALNQRMFSEQLTQPSALERLDPSKMEVLGFAEVEARTVPPTRNAAHVYKIAQKSPHSNRPQTQVCRQDAPCPTPNPFRVHYRTLTSTTSSRIIASLGTVRGCFLSAVTLGITTLSTHRSPHLSGAWQQTSNTSHLSNEPS